MMLNKVIGFTGLAGSGKSTAAHTLLKAEARYQSYSFAAPVYDAASKIFDVSLSYLRTHKREDKPHPFWKLTAREMLQQVGTEAGRNIFGEDIWIRHLENRVKKAELPMNAIILIDDVRFENEAVWVRNHGGLVHVIRTETEEETPEHASEHRLPIWDQDFILENPPSLSLLGFQTQVFKLYNKGAF